MIGSAILRIGAPQGERCSLLLFIEQPYFPFLVSMKTLCLGKRCRKKTLFLQLLRRYGFYLTQ